MAKAEKDEIRQNYEAFVKRLPELLVTHAGKFALIYDQEIVEFFDSAGDAYKVGLQRYPDTTFSIQEVTDTPADLGFFTCALHNGTV